MKGGYILRMKLIKKSKDKRLAIKVVSILTGSILVSSVLLINFDTHSWFTASSTGGVTVSAATTWDIIDQESFSIINDKDGNAVAIKLMKNPNFKGEPTIYFEVEGKISEYILHINPMKLTNSGEDQEYVIPIEPNINMNQYLKLLWPFGDKIEGTMRVKYLNEFISEEYNISFSKKYLRDRFNEDITRGHISGNSLNINESITQEITNLITYLASHVTWENSELEQQQQQSMQMSTMSIMDSNISKQGSYEESLGRVIEIKPIVMPIGRLMLNPEQLSIINLISPKLMPYLDELYSTVENLVAQLNEKLSEIATLEAKAEEMKLSIEELEAEKEELNLEIEKLEASLEAIKQEKNELKEATDLTIFNLNEKVLTLTGNLEVVKSERDEKDKEIESLKETIAALSSENQELRAENNRLTEENLKLWQQINALNETNDSLKSTLINLEGENASLQSYIEDLIKQIDDLTNPTQPQERSDESNLNEDIDDSENPDASEEVEEPVEPIDSLQEGQESVALLLDR